MASISSHDSSHAPPEQHVGQSNDSILHTIDFYSFMLVSFTCLLLFLWWVYMVYISPKTDEASSATRPRAQSRSASDSQPQKYDSNTQQQDTDIEAEMYDQTNKHVAKHLPQPSIMRCSKLLSDSDSGVQDDNDHTHCIVTT
eukprot:919776_1